MLYGRLLYILARRNITPTPDDLRVRDDGAGPYIAIWNMTRLGQQPTQTEIDAVTIDQAIGMLPRRISTRDFMELRLTENEHLSITALANTDAHISRLVHQLLAGDTIDLNSSKLIAGLIYLKSVGVPSVWPDVATADARIAAITA